jgi:anti-anti-sigma factor
MSAADLPVAMELEQVGAVTVARFKVTVILEGDEAERAADRLAELIAAPGRTRLVLNLRHVPLISSYMLGKLVLLYRKAGASGGSFALCEAGAAVEGVLRTTHLTDFLPLYADEAAAVRFLSGATAAPPP